MTGFLDEALRLLAPEPTLPTPPDLRLVPDETGLPKEWNLGRGIEPSLVLPWNTRPRSTEPDNSALPAPNKAFRTSSRYVETPALPAAPTTSGVGPIPARGVPPALAAHWSAITQAAQEAGVEPYTLGAAVYQESKGDPQAVNPRTLATGLLQALPTESPAGRGRGYGYSSQQLQDPALNLSLAVPEFRQAAQAAETEGRQLGWNIDDPVERAVWTIARAQRYGADATGSGAVAYQNPKAPAHAPFRQYVQQLLGASQVAAAAPANPGPVTPSGGLNQFELGLDIDTAQAFCGPTAALQFARQTGRNPTVGEALELAKQSGWSTGPAGMGGPQNVVRMLTAWGVPSQNGPVDWGRIASDVQAGRPVLIDTRDHYFQVVGYDAASGQFNLGGSAIALRASAGQAWYRPEEIVRLGMGAPRSAIYLQP